MTDTRELIQDHDNILEKKFLGKGSGILIGALIGILITMTIWTVNVVWGRYDVISSAMYAQDIENEKRDLLQDARIDAIQKQVDATSETLENVNNTLIKINTFIIRQETKQNGK